MNVKGTISVLKAVGAFHLNQQHLVPLDSEIDGSRKPHIRYPQPVSLACQASMTHETSYINSMTTQKWCSQHLLN